MVRPGSFVKGLMVPSVLGLMLCSWVFAQEIAPAPQRYREPETMDAPAEAPMTTVEPATAEPTPTEPPIAAPTKVAAQELAPRPRPAELPIRLTAQEKKEPEPPKKEPVPPPAPQQPTPPQSTSPEAPSAASSGILSSILGAGGLFGSAGGLGSGTVGGTTAAAAMTGDTGTASASAGSATQQFLAREPSSSVVSGGEAAVRGSTDTGDLLGKSISSVGVDVQRRTPIVTEPRIRGYHFGEIVTTANGGFWYPARPDLDTIVSKLDSSTIANVVVVKGPYSVRQGPGFSFLNVETVSTPRYQGYELHGSTSMGYKTNGQGWNGRQSIYGGDSDYGFRVGWDILSGEDYRSGNGTYMPSSYNSQNFDFAVGYDISEKTHVDLKAIRTMQRNVEFPGLLTDINRLITDAYTLRLASEDIPYFERTVFDAWFNETRFNGDSLRPSKAKQIPQLNDLTGGGAGPTLTVETNGDESSWGARQLVSWGKEKEPQLSAGVDFLYLSQSVNEFDRFGNAPPLNFPIPRARSYDPGIFLDGSLPVGEDLTLKAGTRFDYVQTGLKQPNPLQTPPPGSIDREFELFSGFGTGEYKFNDHWTGVFGAGYAQRAPTFPELYSNGILMGWLQNGFTSVTGNPNLNSERLIQGDVGFRTNYDYVRGGGNFFYSNIADYITMLAQPAGVAPVFNNVNFINTPHATIWGTELFGEADLLDWLTPFAIMTYREGRDQTQKLWLPGIAPMEYRLGFRIHESGKSPKWGLEYMSRIVLDQERVASTLFEQRTGGFTTHDLRAYWLVRQNTLLTGGIENLGDRNYREHFDLRTGQGVLQPGINLYFGLRLLY